MQAGRCVGSTRVRVVLLVLVVLPVALGLLGMHTAAGGGLTVGHASSHAASPAAGPAASPSASHASGLQPHGACHPGCPPGGVVHSTDCIAAPGAQPPALPAVVVLFRSDAAIPTAAPQQPGTGRSRPSPDPQDLSISRT
ncbi:DUF6153 family protein [Sinomonas sp.]|jgi:hypothetical protein|uniref:DUF6153 family protein n=1 Tax=Sinomonas sp. TaxID=1914986 RepID=UPI002FE05AC8